MLPSPLARKSLGSVFGVSQEAVNKLRNLPGLCDNFYAAQAEEDIKSPRYPDRSRRGTDLGAYLRDLDEESGDDDTSEYEVDEAIEGDDTDDVGSIGI